MYQIYEKASRFLDLKVFLYLKINPGQKFCETHCIINHLAFVHTDCCRRSNNSIGIRHIALRYCLSTIYFYYCTGSGCPKLGKYVYIYLYSFNYLGSVLTMLILTFKSISIARKQISCLIQKYKKTPFAAFAA